MKKIILFLIVNVLIISSIKSQKTYVPDDNFEQALIDLGYDSLMDDSVTTSAIDTITSLNISTLMTFGANPISSLTGLEDFAALKNLNCIANTLTSLDVSQNTNLEQLWCSSNQLTSLDVSQNTNLKELRCHSNQLVSLDVSQNTNLEHLECGSNQLVSLDVSNNAALVHIDCIYNQLTSLDVQNGNNINFTTFYAKGNPNLTCIQVDDPIYSYSNWVGFDFEFDSQYEFNLDCGTTADITDVSNDFSLSVYPIPATGILNISFEKGGDYSLFSVSGEKAIQSGKIQNELTRIDISSLNTGTYLLRVITDEGNVITKRVIKQ